MLLHKLALSLQTDFAGVKLLDRKRPKTAEEGHPNRINHLERSNTAPPIKTEPTTIPILRSRTSSRANLTSSAYPKSAVINEEILVEETSDGSRKCK